MIVHCLEFGSHWWGWIRRDEDGEIEPKLCAFFNTTAVPKAAGSRKWVRSWTTPGIVRLNVAGFPGRTVASDFLNINAYAPAVEILRGENRLFFPSIAPRQQPIDRYLLTIRSLMHGRVTFSSKWKSEGVRVICASCTPKFQEILVLMPAMGRIWTDEGAWTLVPAMALNSRPRAQLVAE